MFWDDAKIKGLNPSLKLPHAAISVVYRADASGSTAIFTNFLAGQCAGFKSRVGWYDRLRTDPPTDGIWTHLSLLTD
jgi:ABC-type phosphate transport system substrate-binding protein